MRYVKNYSGLKFLLRFRRQAGPTPYCIAHAKLKNVSGSKKEILFLKWMNRPNRAKALYWRMHKEEHPWKKD